MSKLNLDHWEDDYRMARRIAWLVDGNDPSLDADRVFGIGGVRSMAETISRALRETESEPDSVRGVLARFGQTRMMEAYFANPTFQKAISTEVTAVDVLGPTLDDEMKSQLAYDEALVSVVAGARAVGLRLVPLESEETTSSVDLSQLGSRVFATAMRDRNAALEPLSRAKSALLEAKDLLLKAWQLDAPTAKIGTQEPACSKEWLYCNEALHAVQRTIDRVGLTAVGALFGLGKKARLAALNDYFVSLNDKGVSYEMLAFVIATEPDSWCYEAPGWDAVRQRVKLARRARAAKKPLMEV
jgi:hypothetical protein